VSEVGLPGQDEGQLGVGRRDPAHDLELVVGPAFTEHVPHEHTGSLRQGEPALTERAPRYAAAAGMPAKASRIQAWLSHMALR
jgi:hypothetical protein